MTKALIKGGLLGGLILFLWGNISWMLIPWHSMTLNKINNETVVMQSITSNAPKSGVYVIPNMMQQNKSEATNKSAMEMKGPFIFASVHLESDLSMNSALIYYLIMQIIAAFLVTWLIAKTKGSSYFCRVGYAVLFALAAGFVCYLPSWNWFGFPLPYVLVGMADLIIGWFLAGLLIAKVTARVTDRLY